MTARASWRRGRHGLPAPLDTEASGFHPRTPYMLRAAPGPSIRLRKVWTGPRTAVGISAIRSAQCADGGE